MTLQCSDTAIPGQEATNKKNLDLIKDKPGKVRHGLRILVNVKNYFSRVFRKSYYMYQIAARCKGFGISTLFSHHQTGKLEISVCVLNFTGKMCAYERVSKITDSST